MNDKAESTIISGDTLLTAKRTLEALLVLSQTNRKSVLLPVLYKDHSLRISTAHFIEALVLHERLFCSFSKEKFEGFLDSSRLQELNDIVHPLPSESLFSELVNQNSLDIENIRLGLERLDKNPSIVLSAESLSLFSQNFPEWAGLGKQRSVRLTEAQWNHFQIYEGIAAFTTGIAYSLTQQEGKDITASPQFSGYKIYGDNTLSKTTQAAKSRIDEINASLKQERFVLEAPLVFNHVVEKSSKKHDILSIAIDLRYSKEAIAFRNQCALFDQALKDGNDKMVVEMITEIDDKIKQLTQRISGQTLSIDLAFPFSASINSAELLEYVASKRKRHLIFISQLYESSIRSKNVYDRFHQLL
jgi:hypothetical protein